jgi:chlorobactene glucosyltransferase
MKRSYSWLRLLLWAHAVSIAGFYFILWRRTASPKTRQNEDAPPPTPGPITVSIILPARNEERNIRRCVTSLLEQETAENERYEVLVVDDASTDGTARILQEIAREHPNRERLRVLRVEVLPAGWAGKPHALHTGVQQAHGDWLLFTDADTWHAPQALHAALTQAIANKTDLFSFGTAQVLPGFWEKVMMPMAYLGISMNYPPKLVNDPASPVAIANGQYLLIRRSVYEALGGYARPELRGTLLDDLDLARLVKRQGYRLRIVDGRDLVQVRMYQGLGETWRGWRKNVFLGSRGGVAFVLLQLIGLPIMTIAPFLLPLLLSRQKVRNALRLIPKAAAGVALLELAPPLAYRLWENRELGVPCYYAFTHPLAGALFAGILAQSTWRVLTGKGVDWRGRRYRERAKQEKDTTESDFEGKNRRAFAAMLD